PSHSYNVVNLHFHPQARRLISTNSYDHQDLVLIFLNSYFSLPLYYFLSYFSSSSKSVSNHFKDNSEKVPSSLSFSIASLISKISFWFSSVFSNGKATGWSPNGSPTICNGISF